MTITDTSDPTGTGLPPGLRLVRHNAGLFVTPVIVALGCVGLIVYYRSAEKIF